MNIRKNIDYSEMYAMLDNLMEQQLPQMELYCAIGKAVCQRAEKVAAVMAAEYLHKHYPDVSDFSPRNVRRMRDFYRTYENYPKLRKLAMQIGWIQNVVIMEANLTMELREWYLRAVKQFGWSKAELIGKIATNAYGISTFVIDEKVYNNEEHEETVKQIDSDAFLPKVNNIQRYTQKVRHWVKSENGRKRQRNVTSWLIFTIGTLLR